MSRERLLTFLVTFISILAPILISGYGKLIAKDGSSHTTLERFHKSRGIMGTIVTITVFAKDKADAEDAMNAAFNRVVEIDRLMSNYKEDSELSRLNRQAHGVSFRVSDDTFYVLEKSIEFSKLSGGAFDISVAPLIATWRAAARKNQLPSKSDLRSAIKRVGYKFIDLDPRSKRVKLLQQGMGLDLGGIAKGYAVDVAIAALKQHGIKSGLVDAGGDIYALGERSDGMPWRIGIQDPTHPDTRTWLEVIELKDRAVATSGNYQRYSIIAGNRYSHIIDPRSGLPVDAVPSVTVIAPDTTSADALATAVSVLGVEKGLTLVESMDEIEAMLITIKGGEPMSANAESGKMNFIKSSGFEKFELKEKDE